MSGLTLYNFLRSLPVPFTMHNVGNVDSIGNAIFVAADTRVACAHSTFMFHGVGFDVRTQMRFEQKNLNEMLSSILADQKRIGDLLREHTSLNQRQIRNFFREARTINSDTAKNAGIVHEVRDVNIPPGSPIFSLVFPRQGV